jgi:hypothetical protein
LKKNRSTLKEYFKKGAIPTEANYADLIDSTLNQAEDNIGTQPNDPLHITASGADEALLNFYRVEENTEKLSWQVKQKPAGKSGLSIGDETASRLFIESGAGKVGIGTTAPVATLDIVQDNRSGAHPAAVKGLYVTAAFAADTDGVEFRHLNGSQGIGFGFNTIYATGSNANQDLGLKARGTGKVIVTGSLQVSGGQVQLDGNQKIVFSDADTSNNLKLQLWNGYGLGINGSTLFYAANGQHSWRDNNGTNERMLLTTASDGGLTVRGTGVSSFAGSVGIGTTAPKAVLDVSKTAAGQLGGVLRISNPGGGGNTQAALEFSTYEGGANPPGARILATDNSSYSADIDFQTKNSGAAANPLATRLKITGDGNVGVGITPSVNTKLDVVGVVNFHDGAGAAGRNGNMASGSLTIGSPNKNYGGGWGWNNNTAGLMMETQTNTEIVVHDSNTRLASLMFYEGDTANRITIGRDMSWGAVDSIVLAGIVYEKLDVIQCKGRGDWGSQDHPIMQYFRNKLGGRPVGTMLKAIQDHPSWRGHYWQGWVDADGRIRVIHNYHNTGTFVA